MNKTSSQTILTNLLLKGCSHSRAYQYYAQSVSFDEPLFGYQCESLEDVENGNCKGNVSIFGGEPGAIEQ